MCFMEEWIKEGSQLTTNAITLTTTYQQVFPADPLRFMIVAPLALTVGILLSFSYQPVATAMMYIPPNTFWPSMLKSDLGDLLILPIWARTSSATSGMVMVAQSYNARKKEVYDEWIKRQFAAKFGS